MASGGGGFAGYGVVWGEGRWFCGFVDRSQTRGRVKGWVWTGLRWAWGLFLGGLSFGFGFILIWIRFWFF